jgi:hypothetical protein
MFILRSPARQHIDKMFERLALLAAAALLAASAGPPPGIVPTGASVGPQGHATISQAPPANFTPHEPGAPPPPSAEQIAAHEQFRRAGEFQNQVMAEVQALADRLRRREPRNFVDLYFENEGEPHVVFRFLREPAATLARYSRNPRFKAAAVQYTNAQLQSAADFMMAAFRDDRVIQSVGVGNKQNRAEVEVSVTAAEFNALVARKGISIPDAVALTFRAQEPAAAANRPLRPEISRLVRIFPRYDRPFGALLSINSQAKVVLDDGCFRISGSDQDGALVVFPMGAQLFIDRDGYLAHGTGEVPGYARVGEELIFPGGIGEVTASELVKPIHQACGAGKVVLITATESAAARRVQQTVSQNAFALRELRESYGLSEQDAQHVLERCRQRSGSGTCLISPPPPATPDGRSCPTGTKPSFGLCRTPEGHIRPIPPWIEEALRD